jgi:hypothetical protein
LHGKKLLNFRKGGTMKTSLFALVIVAALSSPASAGWYVYRGRFGQAYSVYDPYAGVVINNYGFGPWGNTWAPYPYAYPYPFSYPIAPVYSAYNPCALPGYWNNGYFIPGW